VARPSKASAIDYTKTHDLTVGLLERATCPAERTFVTLRDSEESTGSLKPALGLAVCSPGRSESGLPFRLTLHGARRTGFGD
jgi:hypothetical protein